MRALCVTLVVEESQTNEIDDKADASYSQQKLHAGDPFWLNDSLNSLNQNREAKSNEEDGINHGSEYLGTCPTKCVVFGRLSTGKLQRN